MIQTTATRRGRRRGHCGLVLVALALVAAACGDDDDAVADRPASDDARPPTTRRSRSPSSTRSARPRSRPSRHRVVTVGVTEQDTRPRPRRRAGRRDRLVRRPAVRHVAVGAGRARRRRARGAVDRRRAPVRADRRPRSRPDHRDQRRPRRGVLRAAARIAPTVAHPEDAAAYFAPWDEQARLIGQALGARTRWRRSSTTSSSSSPTPPPRTPSSRAPVVFLQNAFYDGAAIAYQDGLSTDFLTDLGFTIPSELDAFDRPRGPGVHPDRAARRCSTRPTCCCGRRRHPTDRGEPRGRAALRQPAGGQDGKLVFTDGVTAGAIYFTSPLSLPFVLEHLVPALASPSPATARPRSTPPEEILPSLSNPRVPLRRHGESRYRAGSGQRRRSHDAVHAFRAQRSR